ncbi:arylamine N-acetyltransferase [Halosquirtibacter laminarini]|uniref:Arylamine N-acetyltransferase n=1 Tax=Halosquirtibacter laminarini TaxID=3374600 RepID=A0AC61NPV5_9BACT|nr:arylamine N-acetyltransferase [Prolixibacteraceae bacterium]
MKGSNELSREQIENIIWDEFASVPFHNLYFLLNKRPVDPSYGGTCSDKVIHLYHRLNDLGVQVSLHASFINGEEGHRLLKVKCQGHSYFADIGSGWPSWHLLPLDTPYEYTSFGISYKTEVGSNSLNVHFIRPEKRSWQISIPYKSKSQEEIWYDIETRFEKDNNDVFLHSVRFSQIVEDRFLFLRGDELWIYTDNSAPTFISLKGTPLSNILLKYFKFNLGKLDR